jgi:hypothetical protein
MLHNGQLQGAILTKAKIQPMVTLYLKQSTIANDICTQGWLTLCYTIKDNCQGQYERKITSQPM